MGKRNRTAVAEFILLGLADTPKLRIFLFSSMKSWFWATWVWLHWFRSTLDFNTPKYFFLSHLFFVDFCYSTIIVPMMLANILKEDKTSYFLGCAVKFYLFCTCLVSEVILLAVMAYDHFVAISSPLLSWSPYPGSSVWSWCLAATSSLFYVLGQIKWCNQRT